MKAGQQQRRAAGRYIPPGKPAVGLGGLVYITELGAGKESWESKSNAKVGQLVRRIPKFISGW